MVQRGFEDVTRQRRLQQLVDEYWRTGTATPDGKPGSLERTRIAFTAAEQNLAEYVAKNVKRITVASDPKKKRGARASA